MMIPSGISGFPIWVKRAYFARLDRVYVIKHFRAPPGCKHLGIKNVPVIEHVRRKRGWIKRIKILD